MKRIKGYWIEAIVVLLLVLYALWYRLCIYEPKDILEGLDWTLRLTVIPSLYAGITYGIFRCLFSLIIQKTNQKRCRNYLYVVSVLLILYVIAMIITWRVMLGEALSAYQDTIVYELFRITVKVGGSYWQEGISIVFGIIMAFGVTGIQCKE